MRTKALLCAVVFALAIAAAQRVHAQDDVEIMRIGDVKAGMKGYGLTTLSDGPPQRFQFTVLGVLKGWDPKADLILIHAEGPGVDEAGIVAGMSGSPVYIDDRLIGAVAYGWSFTKIPLGGVQPIEQMLKVRTIARKDRQSAEPGEGRSANLRRLNELYARIAEHRDQDPFSPGARNVVDELILRECLPRALAGALDTRRVSSPLSMRPLPLPLNIRGLNAVPGIAEQLRGSGFMPVQSGASGAGQRDAPGRLVPGGPVAIPLVSGDLDLSASGTVTWVEGNEFLAFGHPMFSMGRADFPVATARAVATVPSMYSSFRLTSTEKVVGRMTHDHSTAIRGELGASSPTFPFRIRMKGNVPSEFNYTVTGHWDWGPWLAMLTANWTTYQWDLGGGEPITYKIRTAIQVAGRDEVIEAESEASGFSMMYELFDRLYYPASQILMNEFEEVHLSRMELDVEVTPGMQAAVIENVEVLKHEVKPGDVLEMDVTLRPWRGSKFNREVQIRIPGTARPGERLPIIVCGPSTSLSLDRSMDPGLGQPANLAQLIRALQDETEDSRSIVVRARVLERGLRYDGHAMPSLPPSIAGVIGQSDAPIPKAALATDVKTAILTDWIIYGSRTVSVPIVEP